MERTRHGATSPNDALTADETTLQATRGLCTASIITSKDYLPRIDITAVPMSVFDHDYEVISELGLARPAMSTPTPSGLPRLIALMLLATDAASLGDAETARVMALDVRASLLAEGSPWDEGRGTVGGRYWSLAHVDAVIDLAEYCAYSELALVEESPPRRTSPAAVQASTLVTKLMTAGGTGTSGAGVASLVFHPDHGFVVVVVGAASTLVIAAAGSGLTLLTHWVGKKLNV